MEDRLTMSRYFEDANVEFMTRRVHAVLAVLAV